MENLTIRFATEADAASLLEIYSYYVINTAVTFEWEVPTVEEFQNRIRTITKKFPYIVAVDSNNKIYGYAYAGTFHARVSYDWTVESSIYVNHECRQNGIGRFLLNNLERILKEQNFLNINACIAYVDQEDEYLTHDSVKFHTKMGYRMVGKFSQCASKFNRWYSMVYMEKHLGEHLPNQPAIIPFEIYITISPEPFTNGPAIGAESRLFPA